MKKHLIIIFAFSLTTACGPKISIEQLNKLTTLTLKVDSCVNILTNQIDSSRMITLTDNYFVRQDFFKNKMKDTVDRATIFIIDEYMRNRKAMAYLRNNYAKFLNEAKMMQKQVQNLEHDVDARLVDEQQFKKYYDLENSNYLQLNETVKKVRDVYLRIDTEMVYRTPKVDSIINAYNLKMDV